MAQHIIIICIISILLWYYYIKSKEQDDKYIPVMIRQSELMQENSVLKQENKKLKMKLKYLENYKQDVSKTFKILDNELGLINEHIKNKQENVNPQESTTQFQTSLTPTVLNSLIRDSQEPLNETSFNENSINSIFNRFLTGDVFTSSLNTQLPQSQPQSQPPQPQPQLQPQPQPQPQPQHLDEINDNIEEGQGEYKESDEQQEVEQNNLRNLQEVHFSVNYLPLNSSYRQFLIRRDASSPSSQASPPSL